MSSAGIDAIVFQESVSSLVPRTSDWAVQSDITPDGRFGKTNEVCEVRRGPRRTPRKSLILVLPENHVVSPDTVADRLSAEGNGEAIDVILACAGQPHGIAALQHRVRDLQILLAPAGTTTEDLRELAMSQAPGDIVTLLSGTPLQA